MRCNSFSPSSRKTKLIKCLTHRAVKLCSPIHLADEISNIKKIFLDNGFLEDAVNTCISNQMASMAVEPEFVPRKCTIRQSWKGPISLEYERQIKSAVSVCFRAADLRVIHYTKPLLLHTQRCSPFLFFK